MNEPRRADPVVRLLTIAVALLAVLVLGLGIGTFLALREASRLRASLGGSENGVASLQQALQRTSDLAEEMTRRQEALAASLGARAERSQGQIDSLRRQRQSLAGVDKGPIDKMAQMVQLNQLMADEMLLMLDHLASTQASVARAMRPLPTQRDLVSPEPATGGGGTAGSVKSDKTGTEPGGDVPKKTK
jgi:hypothetical protein